MNDWGHDQGNYTNTGWKNKQYKPTKEQIEDWLKEEREKERIKTEEDWEDFQEENDNEYGEMPEMPF